MFCTIYTVPNLEGGSGGFCWYKSFFKFMEKYFGNTLKDTLEKTQGTFNTSTYVRALYFY